MTKFLFISYTFLFFLIVLLSLNNLKWILNSKSAVKIEKFSLEKCQYEEFRFKDLLRLKSSVLKELDDLEAKRAALNLQIEIFKRQANELSSKLKSQTEILREKRRMIERARENFRQFSERETPEIFLPLKKSIDEKNIDRISVISDYCSLNDCFDHSKCSILEPNFRIKFTGLKKSIVNFEDFCVHLVDSRFYDQKIHNLNHVILHFNRSISEIPPTSAILASHTFKIDRYRSKFDFILVPPIIDSSPSPDLSPARRKFLFSLLIDRSITRNLEKSILDFIEKRLAKKVGGALIDTDCRLNDCFVDRTKKSIFTFNVIIAKSNFLNDYDTSIKLLYSLKFGAVPIILSVKNFVFPFDDVIDWRRCALHWPMARIFEMHFRLKSINDFDILQMRRNCRLIFDNYLSNEQIITQTLISNLIYRLGLNLPITNDHQSPYFLKSWDTSSGVVLAPVQTSEANLFDQDEYLGPLDEEVVVSSGRKSPSFQHNFTLTSLYAYDRWNLHFSAHKMHEFNPFRPFWLSEAKFKGSGFGFKPINDGIGGSGQYFAENLGGNDPVEYFTVILLTYERENVLISALARLNRLPYLHKIIVVWNGPTPPLLNHTWPKLTAPYVILKMENNSLNNRFLHFREIETEAVLSIDDDVHLRQDEIILGFRVWREARDRIVGFPGRFHGFDKSINQWIYNSNHSCELSMVLTGGAFIHKYYLHEYSYIMSDVIRRKIDEIMNCEDIAMNFLVSHITRKPPLKVTSRWTFRCPGCKENLSSFQSHFDERHDCLNFLTKIYGYNPLINTQFRLDSILFKTKIPQNHQKCFKYI